MIIKVECYSGYKAEETPRRIYLGERKIEVVEIIDRWLAIDHRYFKIKGDDNNTYIIRYDNKKNLWELKLFQKT